MRRCPPQAVPAPPPEGLVPLRLVGLLPTTHPFPRAAGEAIGPRPRPAQGTTLPRQLLESRLRSPRQDPLLSRRS